SALFSDKQAYSAYVLNRVISYAYTWSPFLNRLTSLPTDSTSPATTIPRMAFLGFLRPSTIRAGSQAERGTVKLRTLTSPAVSVVAETFTRTSWSEGAGFSTSLSSRTSGGPYFV